MVFHGMGNGVRAATLVLLFVVLACIAGCGTSASSGQLSSGTGKHVAAYVGGTGEWDSHQISEDEVSSYTEDFRSRNHYEDDVWWSRYLADNDLTPSTWRESVIRQLADRILVEEKANHLGITADEDAVSQRIETAKAQAGIDVNDDQAWRDYLAKSGQTPEKLEDAYRLSSLEQQLFKAEIDTETAMRTEMYDDYIASNLADLVVRHYVAIEFDSNDEAGANACIQNLSSLDQEALKTRLDEIASMQRSESAAADGERLQLVDLGWDFLSDMDAIDPDMLLRKAKLDAGQLYGSALKGDGAYRVVCCVEREQFDGDLSYEAIKSESLKNTIANLALAAHWTGLIQEYLTSLEESADIQVTPMPEGLAYDVEVG